MNSILGHDEIQKFYDQIMQKRNKKLKLRCPVLFSLLLSDI